MNELELLKDEMLYWYGIEVSNEKAETVKNIKKNFGRNEKIARRKQSNIYWNSRITGI